ADDIGVATIGLTRFVDRQRRLDTGNCEQREYEGDRTMRSLVGHARGLSVAHGFSLERMNNLIEELFCARVRHTRCVLHTRCALAHVIAVASALSRTPIHRPSRERKLMLPMHERRGHE